MRKDGYVVAVAGATGAVGEVMLRVLEERKFPVRRVRLLASERSVGKTLTFQGEAVRVTGKQRDDLEAQDSQAVEQQSRAMYKSESRPRGPRNGH